MRSTSALALALAAVLAAAGTAFAADLDQGAKLHEQHCTGCHASLTGGKPSTLYTRSDRKVKTLEGLRKQVQRCELSLGLKWFDEDIASVTAYLNQSYYKLTP
jgi:cytochrome c553